MLVDAFALDWLIPLLGGLDAALGVRARHQVLWGALYLIVVVLTFASMAAFWKDGKAIGDVVEVEIAPGPEQFARSRFARQMRSPSQVTGRNAGGL